MRAKIAIGLWSLLLVGSIQAEERVSDYSALRGGRRIRGRHGAWTTPTTITGEPAASCSSTPI